MSEYMLVPSCVNGADVVISEHVALLFVRARAVGVGVDEGKAIGAVGLGEGVVRLCLAAALAVDPVGARAFQTGELEATVLALGDAVLCAGGCGWHVAIRAGPAMQAGLGLHARNRSRAYDHRGRDVARLHDGADVV